ARRLGLPLRARRGVGADARRRRRAGSVHAAGARAGDRRRHPRRAAGRDPERRPPRQRRAAGGVHPRGPRSSARGGGRVSEAHERGMKVRREVLGDEHVDAATESTTPFTADFQDLITRYAWGEIWARPGLDRKTRSCITLTALVALGRDHELPMHVRAALRNGLTADEIKEVL